MAADPIKVGERLKTLATLATHAAQDVSAEIQTKYGRMGAITFATPRLQIVSDRYWQSVETFKKVNGFGGDDLINPPKKAALTVLAILSEPTVFEADGPDIAVSNVLYTDHHFCLKVIGALLTIRPSKMKHTQAMAAMFLHIRNEPEVHGKMSMKSAMCLFMESMWTNPHTSFQSD